jgi:chromosome segregation ATPase
MADEPENVTIQILRHIQGELAEVARTLAHHELRLDRMQTQIDARFDGVERKLGEIIDTTTKALGTASIANVRHDSASQRFAELELELRDMRKRLDRLEEKV